MKYSVEITRRSFSTRTFVVQATDEAEARAIVNDAYTSEDFYSEDFADYTINSITPDNKYLVDGAGNPYIEDESFPPGGGLDKRCRYNADALYALNVVKGKEEIYDYMKERNYRAHISEYRDTYEKGNTKIVFEVYDNLSRRWAYVHTELIVE